jgi:hypothetical protein
MREREGADLVNFVGIASEGNVADVLTKPLPRFLGVDLQKEVFLSENTGKCLGNLMGKAVPCRAGTLV